MLVLHVPATAAQGFLSDWQQLFSFNNKASTYDVASHMPSTMKEAIILKGAEVKIVDSPIFRRQRRIRLWSRLSTLTTTLRTGYENMRESHSNTLMTDHVLYRKFLI